MTYLTILLVVAIIFGWATFLIVPMREAAVVERLGKFRAVLPPGLHLLIPFWTGDVQGHEPLVAGIVLPPGVHTVLGETELAQGIALAGRLDVDHVGPEVRQQAAAQRRGDDGRALDDLQSLQRGGVRCRHRRPPDVPRSPFSPLA